MSDALTIGGALRAVVARQPDCIALRDEVRQVTYLEFDRSTNHIAAELLKRIAPGSAVAIVAHKNTLTAAALVGAAKAGLIAVVIDPREPATRIAELYGRAGCELLLTTDAENGDVRVPTIDVAELDGQVATPPTSSVQGEDVAGIFFTSGSTGVPKGIVITQAQVVRRARVRSSDVTGLQPGQLQAAMGPIAFGCAGGLYQTLLLGGSAYMHEMSSGGPGALAAYFRAERIELLTCIPSVLRALAEATLADGALMEHVQDVGLGGEALQAHEAELCFRAFPNARLRHTYGSSESGGISANLLSRSAPLNSEYKPTMRIRPWAFVEILDPSGQPVELGEAGEIVVTSSCVAIGYWDDEASTAERFSDAFAGSRRYRTGDIGRLTDGGFLTVEGRADDEVKVRGQRVDLTLVTHALRDAAEVSDAVVMADDGRLVAYVVPMANERVTAGTLRASLRERMPDYMIPSEFLLLDAIPRIQREKVDRVRLRSIRAEAAAQQAPYAAPESDTELRVSRVFEAVLKSDNVGIDDDFQELGGDSLSVLELLEMIQAEFDIDLHDYLVLESAVHSVATVRELARAVDIIQNRAVPTTGTAAATEEPVHLRPDGTAVLRIGTQATAGTRLFIVPGAGEGTVRFLPLANVLQQCTLYSFHRRGLQTRDRPDRTVEQLATRLVSALQVVQPTGPYFLGGFSFGNKVAYDMAQQLNSKGEHVALLVMIDALETDGEPRRFQRIQRMRSRVMRYLLGKPSASRVARARMLADQAGQMGAEYRPLPYDGHTLVVEGVPDGDEQTNWDPELTGLVERLRLDSTHLAMLGPANSAAIAERVDALIERALGDPSSAAGHGGDVGELDDPGLGSVGRG